jgi:hypothetical protein
MEKFPFTSYDFWAYLSAGFLFLFAVDQAAGAHLLMREQWTFVQTAIAISLAYVVGQMVASASSFLFETVLAGKVLGYPRDVLFGQVKAPKLIRWLLPRYFESLPTATQTSALERGQKVGADRPGAALFWAAHTYGRSVTAVGARLDNFLNLYGFCRNVAFVAFLDAAVLYWSYLQPMAPPEHLLWSRLALVAGVGMTLRYLKFFRHFAVEAFTSYAYAKDEKKATP